MLKDYYGFIFLTLLLLAILFFPLVTYHIDYYSKKCGKCNNNSSMITESFTNLQYGEYPKSDDEPILNSYPSTKYKIVDSDNYSSIWKYYPVFSVGSYEQITNNLRYYKNPDIGICMPAEFCGDFYHDKKIYPKSNIIKPLPPVPNNEGIRVNYYRTNEDLFLNAQPGTLVELPALTS